MVNMYIKRGIEKSFHEHFVSGKVVILYGPRRVGKSTFSKLFLENYKDQKILRLNGDDHSWHEYFSNRTVQSLSALIGDSDIVFIDEAQNVPNVGQSLKLLIDTFPEKKVLVTGSSTLGILSKIGEPLVGRSWTYHLYPFSENELSAIYDRHELLATLQQRLIFGTYPDVALAKTDKERVEYLSETCENYLYSDLIELNYLDKPRVLKQLLTLLSHQIGSEVSLSELATKLQIDAKSVDKYLYLLEKSFVIYRLGALKRNHRNEVTKFGKYYFYDLGVRNSLINQFSEISFRNDIGMLWENYLINERMKSKDQPGITSNKYFWRLNSGAEIDYVEESAGSYNAYEFKWTSKVIRPPKSFIEAYPNSNFSTIHRENYQEFIAPGEKM